MVPPATVIALCDAIRGGEGRSQGSRTALYERLGITGRDGPKHTAHLVQVGSERNAERHTIVTMLDAGVPWLEILQRTGLPRSRVNRVLWSWDTERIARELVAMGHRFVAELEAGEKLSVLSKLHDCGAVARALAAVDRSDLCAKTKTGTG